MPDIPAPDFRDRTVLITGGGRGIGRAIALAFARAGAQVALAAQTVLELQETARAVRGTGASTLAIRADVSNPADVDAMVEEVLGNFGRVDVLVNNAGIQGAIGPLAENDVEIWIRTIQVNLIGTFLCCRAVLPGMLAQRSGVVVNLSGGGATGPRPNFSAYSASKAAVVRLTETLAEEVRPFGVRVNAIAPGPIATRMQEDILAAGTAAGAQARQEAEQVMATGGASIDDVVTLAVYLASDAARALTGKLISARFDGWQAWDADRIAELMALPWFTLRRLDEHTLQPFVRRLQ